MSSMANHRKRSHRSERTHQVCLHSMKQFAPIGTDLHDYGRNIVTQTTAPVSLRALTGVVQGRHALGRRKPRESRKAVGEP